ncbi:hypothetical protein [Microcoleus sp. PH2017_22_RUC_O_B]|nr:hypothetical protein [Microcoleus sp. PH2017_22_RUC_O_B]
MALSSVPNIQFKCATAKQGIGKKAKQGIGKKAKQGIGNWEESKTGNCA